MNKDNAHEYLPLVQALADGKTIQHPSGSESWRDYPYDQELTFELDARFYRIKPEPRTFEIARRKSDGLIKNHSSNFVNNEWERITVQEIL